MVMLKTSLRDPDELNPSPSSPKQRVLSVIYSSPRSGLVKDETDKKVGISRPTHFSPESGSWEVPTAT